MLIDLTQVVFGYGDNLIFESADLTVNEGERVALIGANGEGKTTLIKLILGELEKDGGTVLRKNGLKIGYLEQNGGYESGNTVYNEMLAIFKAELSAVEKLSALSADLAETSYPSKEYDIISARIESLNKYISANDCFNIEVKIKTILNGMGFSDSYERIIDTLSGGEKTRLKLARLLLESPELLILDEPTNHLDISTLFWLEEYLQTFNGAILIVSHDRYFLDRIAKRVVEIERKRLISFKGNYSAYKILKAELCERQLKEYEARQEERAKLQDYIDRNLARASTAKSAQSRVKQLERLQLPEKPLPPVEPPRFKFEYAAPPSECVLDISNLSLTRGTKRLIENANLYVRRGDRIAVVGENGAGKSTLLKELLQVNPAIKVGRGVKFAFYDQEGCNLDGENTVLAELWNRHLGYTQTEIRGALARCGLFAEDMKKQVKTLSGGERAKLALCVLACERGNVLLLDEPTNHLDLIAREGLEKALKDFDGTLIFVSHDRYFICALAQKTVNIEGGKLIYFNGGYEQYLAERKNTAGVEINTASKKSDSYRSPKERAEAERKKQLIKRLENEIAECEARESEINALLADPAAATDYIKVNELLKNLEAVKKQLEILYNEYGNML